MRYRGRKKNSSFFFLLCRNCALTMVFFLTGLPPSWAQYFLRYEVAEADEQQGTDEFTDSLSREFLIQEFLYSLRLQGYPTASVQSETYADDTLSVVITKGERLRWIVLKRGNLREKLALKAGYKEKTFEERPFKFQELEQLFENVLLEAQNSGYPFASIRLDSIVQVGEGMAASIHLSEGPYITFDSLEVVGDSKIQPLYLSRLLNIRPGTAFSQEKVDQSLSVIQKVPYVQLMNTPQLTFQNETAKLLLPLNERRMNTLDGIIGVLPKQNEGAKTLVTGQLDLSLYNISGRGRNYSLQWQRLGQYSQTLTLEAEEPQLLGSMLDLELSFSLVKQDSSFLNRDFKIELGYRMHPDFTFGFFSRRKAGDLLDFSFYLEADVGPDVADFRYNNYGVNFWWNTLDQALMPKRGGLSGLEWGIGNKRILQNTGLSSSAYDRIQMNTIQYYLTFSVERYLVFSPSFNTLIRVRGGNMVNSRLFKNDLFRLGGLRSIRGFNENFFFAKRYVYVNFEPRYYFDNYSYFLVFLDLAGLKDNQEAKDRPFSFGGGISLDTDGGIFNFIYALGKSNTQLLGFNFSKIHFGYIGRF